MNHNLPEIFLPRLQPWFAIREWGSGLRIERDFIRLGVREICRERVVIVLERQLRASEVGRDQLVPEVAQFLPADQFGQLPRPLVVLRLLVVARVAERVRYWFILMVDDLRVGSVLPLDFIPVVLEVFLVTGHSNPLRGVVVYPHHDVLPVMLVPTRHCVPPGSGRLRCRLVLLEVERLHVRAPAVVALAARIGVGVVEIRLVAAFLAYAAA